MGLHYIDLRHEARPAAGGVVDGVQLLQQGGGVRETVVSFHQTLHQLAVCAIQQLGVLLKLRGQLEREETEDEWSLMCARPDTAVSLKLYASLPAVATPGSCAAGPPPENS